MGHCRSWLSGPFPGPLSRFTSFLLFLLILLCHLLSCIVTWKINFCLTFYQRKQVRRAFVCPVSAPLP